MTHKRLRFERVIEYSVFFLMLALFCAVLYYSATFVSFSEPASAVNTVLVLVTILFTAIIYCLCISGYTWDLRLKRIFEGWVFIFFLTAVLLFTVNQTDGKPGFSAFSMFFNTLLFLLSAVYWLFFWAFQRDKYEHRIPKKLRHAVFVGFFTVYSLVAVINAFTGFCFFITDEGEYVFRSPLLILLTVLWFFIYLVFILTAQCPAKTKITLASYSIAPLICYVLLIPFSSNLFYRLIFTNLGTFLYLIPIYLLFFNIYVDRGQLLLQKEAELAQSRADSLMLKISPHFIANTMSSIVALCGIDAGKASEMASRFALYLRDYYSEMTDSPMTPFSTELLHIRNYIAIEQMRFPGLCVEYDIKSEKFLLPFLSVQPLVENAVRHGISKRMDASGTIKISAFESSCEYTVLIEDDGVGYHPPDGNDGKRHIGIANVRTRLEMMCGGTLSVSRLPERGTLCEIKIPKEAKR